jgi:hypothetical protein
MWINDKGILYNAPGPQPGDREATAEEVAAWRVASVDDFLEPPPELGWMGLAIVGIGKEWKSEGRRK